MSYQLQIVVPAVPAQDAEILPFLQRLREHYGVDPHEPASPLVKFHAAITRLFPDRVDDDSPWSDAPLLNNMCREMGVLGISQRLEEVLPAVLRIATELGLTVVDEQTNRLYRPGTFDVVIKGALPGVDEVQVTARLAALFKRTPDQARAMLARPSLTVKRTVDRADGERYLKALSQVGCACALMPTVSAPTALAPAAAPAAAPVANGQDDAMQRWMAKSWSDKPAPPSAMAAAAPGAEPVREGPSDSALYDLGLGQKLAIYGILLNFVIGTQARPPRMLLHGLPLWVTWAFVAGLTAFGVARMARGMKLSGAAVLVAQLAQFVPILNLIVLAVMSSRASRALREAGLRVGLRGLQPGDLAELDGRERSSWNPSGKLGLGGLALILGCSVWSQQLDEGKRAQQATAAAATAAKAEVPCPFVGRWVADNVGGLPMEITLGDDGRFSAVVRAQEGMAPKVTGSWQVADERLLLEATYPDGSQHKIGASILRGSADQFRLMSNDGKSSTWDRLDPAPAGRCH